MDKVTNRQNTGVIACNRLDDWFVKQSRKLASAIDFAVEIITEEYLKILNDVIQP